MIEKANPIEFEGFRKEAGLNATGVVIKGSKSTP